MSESNWVPVKNAFCPTGKGGGVDPTCSPGLFVPAGKYKPANKAKVAGTSDFEIQDAMKRYRVEGAYSIQAQARRGEDNKTLRGLDQYIRQNQKKQTSDVLYRGMGAFDGNAIAAEIRTAKKGDVIVDKGYMSTSQSQAIAKKFAGESSAPGDHIILKITKAKGVGAPVKTDQSLGGHLPGKRYDEKEVLLPRNTALRIKSIKKREWVRDKTEYDFDKGRRKKVGEIRGTDWFIEAEVI